MLSVGKQLSVVLLFGTCCLSGVNAAESKDYREIVELGFTHLECAAYGMLTSDDRYTKSAQRSFFRGSFLLSEWLNDAASGKAEKASVEFVPQGINVMPIPGPPLQFHLGYIWAQVESDARERTESAFRNTEHSKDQEKALPMFEGLVFGFGDRKSLSRAKAESEFKESNCEVLR